MAITIISKPDSWSLNRNNVGWNLSTDNEFSTAGVKGIADVNWNLSSYPIDGEQFTLSWNSGSDSITFTFRTNPNDSGEEIPLVTTSALDFLTALKGGLERNWTFNTYFTVTITQIGGNKTIIKAKEAGVRYTPVLTESTSASISITTTSGVDAVRRENFKILLILKVWNSLGTSISASLEATPYNSEVDFDVSNLLDCNIGVNNIPSNNTSAVNFTSSVTFYSAVYAEKYGDPLTARRLSVPENCYALIGGWSKNRIATESFNTLVNDGAFLTNLSERRISRTQPEFLHFISATGIVSSHATLYYDDGTTDTITLTTSPTASVNSLWCFPFNYALIDAQRNTSKNLLYWDVFLSHQNPASPITPNVRYALKDEFELDSTVLVFKNSFGIYEVVEIPGMVEHSTAVARKEAVRVIPRGAGVTESETVTTSASYKLKRKLATGFVSKEEADWLNELAVTTSLYEFDGTHHLPVNIVLDSFPRYNSVSDELNIFTFELESNTNEKGR